MVIEPPNTAIPFFRDARVQTLAYLGSASYQATPDVPLLAEIVPATKDIVGFHGVWVPAGTPQEVITRLNRKLTSAGRDPAVQQKVRAGFAETTHPPQRKWPQSLAVSKRDGARQSRRRTSRQVGPWAGVRHLCCAFLTVDLEVPEHPNDRFVLETATRRFSAAGRNPLQNRQSVRTAVRRHRPGAAGSEQQCPATTSHVRATAIGQIGIRHASQRPRSSTQDNAAPTAELPGVDQTQAGCRFRHR
jgi:hypothetical protein